MIFLYPGDFRRPSEQQVQSIIDLLTSTEVIVPAPQYSVGERDGWTDGPKFERLGIRVFGQAVLSFDTLDPSLNEEEQLEEEWEQIMARSYFGISIQDACLPEYIDWSDPIWNEMSTILGCELKATYYHI